MITTWFQVEFYSQMENRWVPLFAREKTADDAVRKARDWLGGTQSRVTRVTQSTELIWENLRVADADQAGHR